MSGESRPITERKTEGECFEPIPDIMQAKLKVGGSGTLVNIVQLTASLLAWLTCTAAATMSILSCPMFGVKNNMV